MCTESSLKIFSSARKAAMSHEGSKNRQIYYTHPNEIDFFAFAKIFSFVQGQRPS